MITKLSISPYKVSSGMEQSPRKASAINKHIYSSHGFTLWNPKSVQCLLKCEIVKCGQW